MPKYKISSSSTSLQKSMPTQIHQSPIYNTTSGIMMSRLFKAARKLSNAPRASFVKITATNGKLVQLHNELHKSKYCESQVQARRLDSKISDRRPICDKACPGVHFLSTDSCPYPYPHRYAEILSYGLRVNVDGPLYRHLKVKTVITSGESVNTKKQAECETEVKKV